jgi:glycosyltransferase involved in cell wall biosynthesis
VKIHFSNVNFSSRTGPNSFAGRLANELTSRGHEIVTADEDYEVFLAFIEPASQPRPGSRFIQRLDGIWFKPEDFLPKNQVIKATFDACDHVIFQSEFDQQMAFHHWGEREGSVIHNGIKIREPQLQVQWDLPASGKMFICSANWHPQKRLAENIRLYRQVRGLDDVLLILGSNPATHLTNRTLGEFCLGSLDHEQCLALFKRADWMIHLAWLDHCPNVVIEAISQGCPVICAADGGTKELAADGNGIVLPELQEYKFQLTDYDNPPRVNMEGFALPALPVVNAERFNIQLVADKYEAVFRGDA